MGFFSKVFKGIGKVFRKIGRGIKKVVGKIGKMFGKLGIVGQIGLGLLLPGVGQVLSGMLGSVGGALAGSSSALLQGAGKFIQGAIEIGGRVGNAFSTVTEGVTKVIGETVGAVLNKIPGASDLITNVTSKLGINGGAGIDISSKTFGSVWETAQGAMSDAITAGKDIFAPLSSTAPIDTMGVGGPEAQKARILEAEKAGVELPEWDKVLDISEVATDKTLGYTPSPMDALQEIQVTAQKIPTAQPSLLESVKQLPEKFVSAGTEAIQNLPQTVVDKTSSAFTSGVVSKGMQKLGLEDKPEFTTQYYAASVPTIDMSGTTDIGMGQGSFDAVGYMANNMESINMNPYGYNANMYNAATYQNRMRQYGYA